MSTHWQLLLTGLCCGPAARSDPCARVSVCSFVCMYVAPCVRMYVWVVVYGVYVRMCVRVIRGRVGL